MTSQSEMMKHEKKCIFENFSIIIIINDLSLVCLYIVDN